jgi:6-pyruvoyltetrahydropterin/6-carboxytetrahydropterin synthase
MKDIKISVRSQFRASHYHDGALDEPIHDHTFIYTATLKGPLNEEGFLVDFREVEKFLEELNKELSFKVLNKIIPNSTTENVAIFLFNKIKERFPQICEIHVFEKENYSVTYEG